jgi:cyclomaltodextrinase / maltogenic alpha-amylase / neopullulanase
MSKSLRTSLCVLLAALLVLATPHLSRSIDFSLCASVAKGATGHRLKSMLRPAAGQQPSSDVSGVPARQSRDWVRDGVVYEIFPRAFSPEGNFNGITAQLDRLKDLGVTVLWLMPIHQIGQEKKKGTIGSPYAVRDYYSINPDYGTKEELRRLITEAHKRGLKIIIDIVANHTSWDSVMMKNPDFYKHDAQGKIIFPYDWSDVAWLNYENPKLREYMTEMLKYWIREFDLDGFRCDVAGEVPVDFWERARSEIEKIKPDIVMLAEASQPDLLVKAFDLDYAWPLHSTLTEVLKGSSPATAVRQVLEQERSKFPRGSKHMLFSDNHDESRAIARFGERGALAASGLVFTLDGVPLLYNGMEVGDTTESGAPALFERLPIFWGIIERRRQFPQFYKQMIALRRDHPALRRGEPAWLRNSDEQRVVSYLRRDGNEELLITINLSNKPFAGFVEVANGASFKDVTPDSVSRDRISALPALTLESWGFRIFMRTL